jgi:hypothetical protein
MDCQHQKTEVELCKEESDKHRERGGAFQRMMLHVLRNPKNVGLQRLEGCTGAMDLC